MAGPEQAGANPEQQLEALRGQLMKMKQQFAPAVEALKNSENPQERAQIAQQILQQLEQLKAQLISQVGPEAEALFMEVFGDIYELAAGALEG